MRYEIRYIEWRDSAGNSGWQPLSDSKKLVIDSCCSVGFVVAETDEQVTLLQSFTNREDELYDQSDNVIAIPKFAITKAIAIPFQDEEVAKADVNGDSD